MSMTDKDGKPLSSSEVLAKGYGRLGSIVLEIGTTVLWYFGWIPFAFIRMPIFRLSGIRIHSSSIINPGARVYDPRGVSIGEDSIIGERAVLDGRGRLAIGSHVDIASEVMIYNSEHLVDDSTFKAHTQPVEIGDYVFIGPRVIILPGVKIGKGAVVGAGAVVTKDVAEYEIVGGVPAKVIGMRNLKNPSYRLRRKFFF